MADLTDYLTWRGDLSFKASPFCDIDALVLTTISYLNFKNCISENFGESRSLEEVWKLFENSPDYEKRCDLGALLNNKIPDLFKACATSKRFSKIRACGYTDIYDEKKCQQFAAMVFELEDNLHMVTFRGTDDTLIGWKEDFNLGYVDVIPSQKAGLSYFEKACSNFEGKLIISGHSKGGNVALYAGTNASPDFQKRIKTLYNFDGPSLPKNMIRGKGFASLGNRVKSFYPEMCMVGMIFHHLKKKTIIKSKEFAVMQHDPLSWEILGNSFLTTDNFKQESLFFESTVNDWIENLTKEEIRDFVDTLFSTVLATGAKTNSDLEDNKFVYSTKIIAEFAKLENEKRHQFLKILREFKRTVKGNLPILNIFSLPEL